jgi:hypothetical protein
MVVAKNKIDNDEKYTYNDAMWGASPDGVHSWLHAKPLDAATG